MDGKQKLRIRVIGDDGTQRAANPLHRRAEIFPPVAGDENEPLGGIEIGEFPRLFLPHRIVALEPAGDIGERIDDGVAGDVYLGLGDPFAQQIAARGLCGGEMIPRQACQQAAIALLRPGRVSVAGAEPGLDMADGDAPVISGKGGGQRAGRVALDDDQLRRFAGEDLLHAEQDARRHIGRPLIRRHDIEIVSRRDRHELKRLVEHFAVLARGAEFDVKRLGARAQGVHHRRQLERFGPGSDGEENFALARNHQTPVPCWCEMASAKSRRVHSCSTGRS